MINKFSLLGLILIVILAVGFIRSSSTNATPPPPQATVEVGTLDWYVQQAQAQGVDAFRFRSGRVEYTEPDTWDDVLANYSFVTAQLVTSKSYPAALNRDIETWYKFRVNEKLSQKPIIVCDGCPAFPTAPADMLPLQANEMLVAKSGGTLAYNGIFLTASDPEFPDFLLSQNYLFILQLDSSSQVGSLSLGPWGAYSIDANAILHVINPGVDVYHDDLTSRYGNSLNQLRAVLNPTPPPPPSSCDSVQQQNCEDGGGTWNSTNCTCRPADSCVRRPWYCA